MARSIEEIRNDIATVQKAIDEIKARKENRGQFSSAEIAQMYSLDPKAAEFFANKQAAEQTLRSRESIASLKLGDISKKDKLELQQLWKENTRALSVARINGEGQDIINMYSDNVDRLVKQLQKIDPTTWGTGDGGSTDTSDISTSAIDSAKLEAKTLIDAAIDEKNLKNEDIPDGVIDNVSDIKSSIRKLKDKYKISDKDINDILQDLSDKEDEIKKMFDSYTTEETRKFGQNLQAQAASRSGGAIDERAAKKKIETLQSNPSSIPDRADAVLWLMRKASGAMIGPNEMLQYMQGKLPPDQYDKLAADLSPTGMKAILGLFTKDLNDAQISSLTNRYLNFIDVNKIIDDLNNYANIKKNIAVTSSKPKKPVSTTIIGNVKINRIKKEP